MYMYTVETEPNITPLYTWFALRVHEYSAHQVYV